MLSGLRWGRCQTKNEPNAHESAAITAPGREPVNDRARAYMPKAAQSMCRVACPSIARYGSSSRRTSRCINRFGG